MSTKELVGVNWNPGAALVADYNSSEHWGATGEDLGYVIRTLESLEPDFVTLQELHTRDERTGTGPHRAMAKEIADALGMHYVDQPVSPSHIDGVAADDDPNKSFLTLAVLSRKPIEHSNYTNFPQPEFPIYIGGKGDPIPPEKRHNKGMLVAELESGLTVVSAQTLPARFLGFLYTDEKSASLTEGINRTLLEALPPKGEIFVGGDLNYDERWGAPLVGEVFTAFSERNMRSVFPVGEPSQRARANRPEAKEHDGTVKTDFVLTSMPVVRADVIRTGRTDHPATRVVFQR